MSLSDISGSDSDSSDSSFGSDASLMAELLDDASETSSIGLLPLRPMHKPMRNRVDQYSVNYTRQGGKLNSGMVDGKGVVFPDDPSKRMISLPAAANAPRSHKQPKGSRDRNFLVSIVAQFFYTPGLNPVGDLSKFQAIATNGRFMVLKNGKYMDVQRSPRVYR